MMNGGVLLSCVERHSLRHAIEERRGLRQTASVQSHRDPGRLCAGQVSRKYRYKRSSQPLRWSCFGEAAVAGLNKGKVHLLGLGKNCKVAM